VGDAFVNHVGNVHVAPETRTPGFVETCEEDSGGVTRFDGFGSHNASHLTGVDGKANALAYQRRAMPTGVARQEQAVTRETFEGAFGREQAGMVFDGVGIAKLVG